MNAVEIEEAVSALAVAPFEAEQFPYAFLAAYGNKETAIKRLRAGAAKSSDLPGGLLQPRHIHVAVCEPGNVEETLGLLRASPRTAKGKVRFVLATDGIDLVAEDLVSGEPLACAFQDLTNNFAYFLPLAGISTVQQVLNNPIDIKATGRLNKLYLELIHDNEDWSTDARRQDLNQFMARLIFCLFAEDTGIFFGEGLFTNTLKQMSDSSNTHEVIRELFRAMDTPIDKRAADNFRPWADAFPYVNGGLFANLREVPRFSKLARSYLLRAGELDWKAINPDIFGSMIQGIADDEERGSLGMHYTSVPNILKVLDPLFLDDLREQLEQAGDNARKLLNLRKRIASIRVFDPACGSGNFLIVAYIKMREIEAEIIRRRNDDKKSSIKLTNFFGIDIKHFACETARLSLLIAEFQSDSRLIGQMEACSNVLPLHKTGQIHCGNALRMDWLEVCPPATQMEQKSADLFGTTVEQAEIDFDGKAVETYICGNPPYKGSKWQTAQQKADLTFAWTAHPELAKTTDYVTGWLAKAAAYLATSQTARSAFVMTNSVVQGQQAGDLWMPIFEQKIAINFAHQSFKWHNLAADKAGVTVVVVGIAHEPVSGCVLFDGDTARRVNSIGCFLVPNQPTTIIPRNRPHSGLPEMVFGNMPRDGGHLLLDAAEACDIRAQVPDSSIVRRYVGSKELIHAAYRYCLWIADEQLAGSLQSRNVAARLKAVENERLLSNAESTRKYASRPHLFVQRAGAALNHTIAIPGVSSENRDYLPVDLLGPDCIISNKNFGIFDGPLWCLALIASRLHWVWVGTVCVRMRTDFSYSNTLGWNSFPVPPLTDNNKSALTHAAENILLAREAHFPATIADLYDPEKMPDDLRRAHEDNDETLERIYVGRRFRNDTERLEKLFELYTKLTKAEAKGGEVGV